MNEVLHVNQEVQSIISSMPWLAKLQSNALNKLRLIGFPKPADEDWKYTAIDGLVKQFFLDKEPCKSVELKLDDSVLGDKSHDMSLCHPALSSRLVIYNGVILNQRELERQLPKGVLILPLVQALSVHEKLIKPYLGHILKQEHGFQFLNTAMLALGLFIYIPAGVHLKNPIVLNHFQNQAKALHLRHLLIAEEGSKLSLIEDYHGLNDCPYLTNTITEIYLAPKAQVVHYKIQREAKSAYHIGHLAVKQNKYSEFASHSVSLGGKLVRSDTSIDLQGDFAQTLLNGIYAPVQGQHIDHHTSVYHYAPHCHSQQDYKGILQGNAHAVFNGKVFVAKDGHYTEAKQQNKNLLLSHLAEINTKPQLDIFNDNILCSHGATVGQLDEEALFYLRTRGFDSLAASQYLMHAFTLENLALIPNPSCAEWVEQLLNCQLEFI